MRILLINPNTSVELTEKIARYSRGLAGADAEILPITGRFGGQYISTRATAAIAAHAALDALAEHGEGCDAVFLACFGDPGLAALRELSLVPVIGMADAACHLVCTMGQRFSIVTGGVLWKPMLEEFVQQIGLMERLASVRCVPATGGEIARDPQGAVPALVDECRAAAAQDGADVVILGGAGLAGLASSIVSRVPVPVICSVEAGTRAALAAASGLRTDRPREFVPAPAVASTGLSKHLARALSVGSG